LSVVSPPPKNVKKRHQFKSIEPTVFQGLDILVTEKAEKILIFYRI
jgi:hypothetical protein